MKYVCSLLFSAIIFFVSVGTRGIYGDTFDQQRQVHIVYMGALPVGEYSPSSHHVNMLRDVLDFSFARKSLIRSYTRSFNGFAAYLTEHEREKLTHMDGVVSVFPSRTLQLHTTRSWDFMGFNNEIQRLPKAESDIIIGVIDTGIWPESESFSDEHLGPVPEKWKGACNGGKNFTCNKKIVGARWYRSSGMETDTSVRDTVGHGTHTASTAAGNNVNGASFYGIANGTARGGVPSARIASYKVCYEGKGCKDTDILAAFDDAIADGVDIISISIGGDHAIDLTVDVIAIGSFHAMEKGILTVNSAGNSYSLGTTGSFAPWMLSVAASNTDRQIIDKVILGNGVSISGNAVNSFDLKGKNYPIISGEDATNDQCDKDAGRSCIGGCLDSKLVKGKILVCEDEFGIKEAIRTGPVGLVVTLDSTDDESIITPLPATILRSKDDLKSIYTYLNFTRTPSATITKSESARNVDAPVVASFSSKGPNLVIPEILKPDLTAPGVDILAAYSPVASISEYPDLDKRSVNYNIVSGTSMACPHVAGAAAYVKTFHPQWSPSAIKSALMTTAWQMNSTKNPEAEFAYGAGHIDPRNAINPGLVYETERDDYIGMLCSRYNVFTIKKILGANIRCPTGAKATPKDMNYPSMAFKAEHNMSSFAVNFSRTVTNVGQANSTYKANVSRNSRINVTVVPSTLSFTSVGEKKSFVVSASGTIYGSSDSNVAIESASLLWSDGSHTVRSPIVVYVI